MQTITDIGTLIARTTGTCGGRPRIAGNPHHRSVYRE
jgi:uncharacterized protein (DUF433 family)